MTPKQRLERFLELLKADPDVGADPQLLGFLAMAEGGARFLNATQAESWRQLIDRIGQAWERAGQEEAA